jgi:hypothetical protein
MIVEAPTMITEWKNGDQKSWSAERYCSRVGVNRICGGSAYAAASVLKLVTINQKIGPKITTTARYSTRFCR